MSDSGFGVGHLIITAALAGTAGIVYGTWKADSGNKEHHFVVEKAAVEVCGQRCADEIFENARMRIESRQPPASD
jgi:hypothetical protein